MRLFLCEAAIERAWRGLAQGDAEGRAAAARSLDKAGRLIEETRYRRRLPDLALARAALALAEGDRQAAQPHLEALIAAMQADDLWSFLPDLARLVEQYDLSDRAPTLETLRAARAEFDAAADAAFEAARKPAEAPSLSDEQVMAMLADPGVRALLEKVYKDNNIDAPFEQIPKELHAKALAMLLAQGVIQIQEAPQQPEPAPEAPPLPEERVDALLADPEIRKLLEKIYESNNMHAPLDHIPRETHAGLLAQMAARGMIKVQEGPSEDQAAAEPTPPAEPAPPSSAPSLGERIRNMGRVGPSRRK